MAKADPLANMSLAQLRVLRDRVDSAIVAAAAAEKLELRDKIQDMIERAGFRVRDILDLGPDKGRASRSNRPVRYRHPDNPGQVWSGRGRRPQWLVEALKKGQPLDHFRT